MSVRMVCEVIQCTMDPNAGLHRPFLQALNVLHTTAQNIVKCVDSVYNGMMAL
jgi:hypothetical protein